MPFASLTFLILLPKSIAKMVLNTNKAIFYWLIKPLIARVGKIYLAYKPIGDKLMSSLAKKMNATVFASASLNYAFRPGEIVNSQWKMYTPGTVTTITMLKNVYFDQEARIHYAK